MSEVQARSESTRRGAYLTLGVALALILSTLIAGTAGATTSPDQYRFRAVLDGDSEVPPVETDATGLARVIVRGDDVGFQLRVSDIDGVTAAHFHHAPPGENGGVVAVLFASDPPTGPVDGVLARGVLGEADLIGDFEADLGGFLDALHAGNIYVNVHTVDHPSGELRGDLAMRADDGGTTTTTTQPPPTTTTQPPPTTTTTTTQPPPTTTTTTTQPPPTTTTTTTLPPAVVDASMGEFFYSPDPLVIDIGDTVEWTNDGGITHTTTSGSTPNPDGTWDSGNLAPGQTFSHTFNSVGTFEYFCTIHPTLMSSTVVVES